MSLPLKRECLIAIDPGYAQSGEGNAIAYFRGGRLRKWWFQRSACPPHKLQQAPEVVVVEEPQLDGRSWNKAPALLALSWEGGVIGGLYAGRYGCLVQGLTPTQWKGSQHKPQQHQALWETLDAKERELLGGLKTRAAIEAAVMKGALCRWKCKRGAEWYPRSFKGHNALDAVALGAVVLGRLR